MVLSSTDISSFVQYCIDGNLEQIIKMYDCDNSYVRLILDNSCTPLVIACQSGHLDVAKWIYDVYPESLEFTNAEKSNVLLLTCMGLRNNRLYMHEFKRKNIVLGDSGFATKNTEIVKWIHEKDPLQMITYNIYQQPPIFAAKFNFDVELVQWIFETDPSQILKKNTKNHTIYYHMNDMSPDMTKYLDMLRKNYYDLTDETQIKIKMYKNKLIDMEKLVVSMKQEIEQLKRDNTYIHIEPDITQLTHKIKQLQIEHINMHIDSTIVSVPASKNWLAFW
jgi:hypothetical protein